MRIFLDTERGNGCLVSIENIPIELDKGIQLFKLSSMDLEILESRILSSALKQVDKFLSIGSIPKPLNYKKPSYLDKE